VFAQSTSRRAPSFMSASFIVSSMLAGLAGFSVQPFFGFVHEAFATLFLIFWAGLEPKQELVPASARVWTLPCELLGLVGKLLPVRDIAALSAVHNKARVHVWDCPGLWHDLAVQHHLNIRHHQMSPPHFDIPCDFALAGELREAFRRACFRLDGARLQALGAQLQRGSGQRAVLGEVTLMARGLMLRDGHTLAEELCAMAERALDDHDAACALTTQAAETLIEVAQADVVMFTDSMVERLEQACCSAQQLHTLMVSSLQRHWAQSVQDLEESFWSHAELMEEEDDSGELAEPVCPSDDGLLEEPQQLWKEN